MIKLIRTKHSVGDYIYYLGYSGRIYSGFIWSVHVVFSDNGIMYIQYDIKGKDRFLKDYPSERIFKKQEDAQEYRKQRKNL